MDNSDNTEINREEQKDITLKYLGKFIQDIVNDEIDQTQLDSIYNYCLFYDKLLLQQQIINKDQVDYEEMMKYLFLGYYIYTFLLSSS